MSSYIGKVKIGSGDNVLVGSTLYGVCNTAAATAAKTVTLSDFDTKVGGVTVHVRFANGNSVTSSVTLAVGSTSAVNVVGNCVCNANDVVAFTYMQEKINNVDVERWYVNSNVVAATGDSNGTVKINGSNVSVAGLGTAAYTASGAYATAAQGTLADNAMPKSGGTFSGAIYGPAVDDTTTSGALATVDYVRSKTAGLSGLTGAMHFKGITTTEMTDGRTTAAITINGNSYTPEPGDVAIYNSQEYVWVETNASTHAGYWELLGDEGSYVLQSSQQTGSIGSASAWSSGSASNAVVEGGVLKLTNSTVPSLTVTSTNVIVPATTST